MSGLCPAVRTSSGYASRVTETNDGEKREHAQIVGAWVSLFTTLCIFSFLYAVNPLYKLAEHLYLGVSIGVTSSRSTGRSSRTSSTSCATASSCRSSRSSHRAPVPEAVDPHRFGSRGSIFLVAVRG
jgi:hypothetical protein